MSREDTLTLYNLIHIIHNNQFCPVTARSLLKLLSLSQETHLSSTHSSTCFNRTSQIELCITLAITRITDTSLHLSEYIRHCQFWLGSMFI